MPTKSQQEIDRFARDLKPDVYQSVYGGTKATTEKRYEVLFRDYPDPDLLRQTAGQIKQHTLENLDKYLPQAEAALKANGAQVHFASDGDAANRMILEIMKANGCKSMVKSKSMVSEETGLGHYLEDNGMKCLETDLGEFIIQIDNDHPSHIVKPVAHKNRRDIAKSFEREGLGDYNDDPETITRRARKFLRGKYFEADVGLTGANFVSAESGRLTIVTNEGNARFCMAATPIHIAIVGIEKLVPHDRDLALFTALIGRSGTGQHLTSYTQFIGGPKREGQPDGPEQMHVIFVDNKRTEVLASQCSEILRCIRCGACLNVCPVYRQASGHAYRSVYPGPVGAVLSPLLAGSRFPELADLPKASSLCGACNEVCPVNIPIPDLLLRLRDKAKTEHAEKAMKGTPPMGMFGLLASQPHAWRAAMTMGAAMNLTPDAIINIVPPAAAWNSCRQLPKWRGGKFRNWMKSRSKN
ncbi:LutB/LldF family L-lactate oxidation iron-sulfur protein [Ruficoccus sp. ZRK36]|uniref:LutB/LldF family L-lactate oxidation iron-sulfur protein n=1 Tax=Ruficoccus sp. ZRK36 TaxID=2866311 RepID=UPI001C73DEA2|nr:LutB/LldF family L-lactate oxidation iron-sulfur protein [Ruficoccus sp. ZRK36]QYY35329.1 iron-sulfur cluster-binding protein [Ruficoccus sp. ZRK36]